ncbi:MAG: TldD/PmbA family protein [Solirubrobacterales bacterium]
MLEKKMISRVLTQALTKGGDFAEIYCEEKEMTAIICEDNKVERVNLGREIGAGIRVVTEGNTAYAHTNDLSEEGLLKTAETVAHIAEGMAKTVEIAFHSVPAGPSLEFLKMPEQFPFEEKVETVLAANQAARSVGEEIKQVMVSLADVHKRFQIANSSGDLIEDELVRTRFVVNAVAARDGVIQTGFDAVGGVIGWELLDENDARELGRKAAQRAVQMLDAKPCPAGKMPVVMSSEAGGTMVHEACGHGLEADLVQRGLSVYGGKMGQQVAGEEISVIDDSTLFKKNGTLRYDDEGTPGKKNVLIEKGILKSYMQDRITALKDGVDPTGNGRRESYQHKPIPRMTNTYIASGSDDPDQIIRDTQHGLLVRKMGGGQVNTTNGDFVFEVQEGYIIEDGEIKYPVRGATLSGNGPEVLNNIDRIGRDIGFAIGTCGKDGQGVPVSDAQPTMRIKSITVGGVGGADGPQIKRIRRL